MSAKERQKGKVTKDSVTLLPCFYFVEVSGRCAQRAAPGAGGGRGERRGADPRGTRCADSERASVRCPHRLVQNPYVMLCIAEISIDAPCKEQA